MARTAGNPLPQFITSPDLGAMIAAELHDHADNLDKMASASGEGITPTWRTRVRAIHNAADQLDMYCEGVTTAR